jgi:hypothetical protein
MSRRVIWGGYRTGKAVACIIDVGVNKPAWVARYKDQACGPRSVKEAKAAALAMAKGACGTIGTLSLPRVIRYVVSPAPATRTSALWA